MQPTISNVCPLIPARVLGVALRHLSEHNRRRSHKPAPNLQENSRKLPGTGREPTDLLPQRYTCKILNSVRLPCYLISIRAYFGPESKV